MNEHSQQKLRTQIGHLKAWAHCLTSRNCQSAMQTYKKSRLAPKTLPPPLGPQFFYYTRPGKRRSRKKIFRFFAQTKSLDYCSEMYNEITHSRSSGKPAEAQHSQQKLRTQIGHLKNAEAQSGLRCCTGAHLNSFRQQKLTDRQQEPT